MDGMDMGEALESVHPRHGVFQKDPTIYRIVFTFF